MKRVRNTRPPRDESKPHLSILLYCLRKAKHKQQFPKLWSDGGPFEEQDESTLKMMLGEDSHILLGGKTDSVKTKEFEGILYTPDDVFVEEGSSGEKRIVEFKTTAYSAKKTIRDLPQYLDQLGGYCVAEGTNKGRLVVIHTRGYYNSKDPITGEVRGWNAVMKVYDVEFHPLELEGWKRELIRRKKVYESAQSFTNISTDEAWSWECGYCPLHKSACEGGGKRVGAFQYFEFKENK